jgi:outer membrane protein assembly factor BamB
MSRRTPWLALFALLVASVGLRAANAASPTLTLQPTGGPPTTVVEVSGTGFGSDEAVDVSFGSTTVATGGADQSGAFSTTFRVPRSAPAGAHQVTGTGQTSELVASSAFTVALPSIVLSMGVGPPLASLTVTGANFRGLESIEVAFDTRTVTSATADPTGAFSVIIRVPRAAPSGRHDVTVTGGASRLVGRATFVVRIERWPQYGFDPGHSGRNPREVLLDPSTVGDLTSAWTATLDSRDDPAYAVAFSSPAVVGGVLYIGTERGKLDAIDAWTGAIRWTTDTGQTHNWSSPAVVRGIVYVGGGEVSAIRASTGAVLWTVNTGDDTWSPTVSNGVVYVGSKGGKLYAIRASNGSILWTRVIGDTEASGTSQAPTVADGVVYVNSGSNDLSALDAVSGRVEWTVQLGGEADAPPAVVDGVAYAPSTESLQALDASTGHVLWTAPVGGELSPPAVGEGLVFVGGSDGLSAFDAATGALRWTAPLGYCVESSPAVANGVVYVVGARLDEGSADLYALDAVTGEALWSAPIESEGGRPDPRVVNGFVYAGSESGTLYAFALP